MKKSIILNSQGEPIVLNAQEQATAKANEKIANSFGFNIDMTALTTVLKKVVDQKFFEIAPADFMPVRVGEGAWSDQLISYRSMTTGGEFATGLVNQGNESGRLASTDAAVDSVSIKVQNWAKEINWTLFQVQHASKAGNWDVVTEKEKSRKKNWDLGIQKTAFLGLEGDNATRGLLNLAGITNNTANITKPISTMTPAELKTFVAILIDKYRANCSRTAWPTHFAIPESDFLGLASQASAEFPVKTVLDLLLEAFRVMTKNPNFQILACSYGDATYNSLTVQRYALYNSDESSLRMDIPVDYTNTLANSVNSFSFQNVGYGQFTGVQALRPDEMLYFSF